MMKRTTREALAAPDRDLRDSPAAEVQEQEVSIGQWFRTHVRLGDGCSQARRMAGAE